MFAVVVFLGVVFAMAASWLLVVRFVAHAASTPWAVAVVGMGRWLASKFNNFLKVEGAFNKFNLTLRKIN